MDLPQEVYLGLCVASHKRDVIATAEFSDIRLAGSVSESWQVAETGWDQPGNSPDDLYVALTDTKGRFAIGGASGPGRGQCRRVDTVGDSAEPFRRTAGVDLTSIKSMRLGVGNRTGPKSNGAGRIYIDDIRVVANP